MVFSGLDDKMLFLTLHNNYIQFIWVLSPTMDSFHFSKTNFLRENVTSVEIGGNKAMLFTMTTLYGGFLTRLVEILDILRF